jgi:hypothetical protein
MAPKRATKARGGASPAAAAAERAYAAIMALPSRGSPVLLSGETPAALLPVYQAIYDDLATLTVAQKEALAARIDTPSRRTTMARIYNTGRMLAASAGQAFPGPLPATLVSPTLSDDERTAIESLMMLSRGAPRSATAARSRRAA